MRPIIFLDTETCGLGIDDPIWEIALIRRDERGEARLELLVEHDIARADALPPAFRVDHDARYRPAEADSIEDVRETLTDWLRPNEDGKAVIVGSAPDFDMTRIQHQLGMEQIWNHHLVDAPTLAMGWWYRDHAARLAFPPSLDEAAKMHGIDPREGRHTAMRDCELARDIFDRATRGRFEVAA